MDERSEVNPDHNKRTADHTKKRKAAKTPQVFTDFLQRKTKQGWTSKAKSIPTITKGLPTIQKTKAAKTPQVFNDFLQRKTNTNTPTGHITAYLKIFHKKKLQIS